MRKTSSASSCAPDLPTDMFQPPTNNDLLLAALTDVIDKAMQANNDSQPRRQYLGASAVGDPCSRKLAYSFHATPKDADAAFPGKTLRMFDMGHDGETRMAEYLRLAGFNLQTHKDDGKQIGIADCGGKFKGHLDGVIHAGPALPGLTYPALWENKALGDSTYRKFKKDGLKGFKLTYFAQVQIYMGYYELPCCLFTAINRDSGEIHVELVMFDAVECQALIHKATRITESERPEEFERSGKHENHHEPNGVSCKFCDYRSRCWELAPVEIPKPTSEEPAWRRRS